MPNTITAMPDTGSTPSPEQGQSWLHPALASGSGTQKRVGGIRARKWSGGVPTRALIGQLPDPGDGTEVRPEGYLYVIAFSSGTVKVGQTEDPYRRILQHRADAAAFNVRIEQMWISIAHTNFKENEFKLIEACAAVSDRSRKEYFHAVSYDQAVQFACDLTYWTSNTSQGAPREMWA